MDTVAALTHTLAFNDFILDVALTDVTDAIARRTIRDAGPSIAWNLGHFLNGRATIASMAACDGPTIDVARFGSGVADTESYPSLAELRRASSELSPRLVRALERLTPADLSRPSPIPLPHHEQSLLDALRFFVWHETLHVGQINLLRSQWGLTPTATLVQAGEASVTL